MVSDRKQEIDKTFASKNVQYDQNANLQKGIAQKLASMLPDLDNPRVLEIGCGTGFLTQHLFERYHDGEFDITDLSQGMVDFCQDKFKDAPQTAKFHQLDAENVEQLQSKYDLIVGSMVVQWFDDPVVGLQKLSEVAPVYYATLGQGSFHQWKETLKALDLSNGVINVPESWPGVISEETQTIEYQNARGFLQSLKEIGTGLSREDHTPLSITDMRRAMKHFDSHYEGEVSWQVVYGALET